jgi:hypothetical protein
MSCSSARKVAQVAKHVEEQFAYQRAWPADLDEVEIPYIGGSYDYKAPREQHAELIATVIRAVASQRFYGEMDPSTWRMPPLPLDVPTIEYQRSMPIATSRHGGILP